MLSRWGEEREGTGGCAKFALMIGNFLPLRWLAFLIYPKWCLTVVLLRGGGGGDSFSLLYCLLFIFVEFLSLYVFRLTFLFIYFFSINSPNYSFRSYVWFNPLIYIYLIIMNWTVNFLLFSKLTNHLECIAIVWNWKKTIKGCFFFLFFNE